MTFLITTMRLSMAAFYLAAGIVHLTRPDRFMPIMPDWVPVPRQVILATGICEMAGAVGLLAPAVRGLAGVLLALYALCVWPANFKHAFEHVVVPPIPDSWWYHAPRLAFQPVLIWWALHCSGIVSWPSRVGEGG